MYTSFYGGARFRKPEWRQQEHNCACSPVVSRLADDAFFRLHSVATTDYRAKAANSRYASCSQGSMEQRNRPHDADVMHHTPRTKKITSDFPSPPRQSYKLALCVTLVPRPLVDLSGLEESPQEKPGKQPRRKARK
jgi:hypothetical protein